MKMLAEAHTAPCLARSGVFLSVHLLKNKTKIVHLGLNDVIGVRCNKKERNDPQMSSTRYYGRPIVLFPDPLALSQVSYSKQWTNPYQRHFTCILKLDLILCTVV